MKHRSDMKFCSCRHCKRGLRRGLGNFVAKKTRRLWRRKVRLLCKAAINNPEIEIPERVSVPYTD